MKPITEFLVNNHVKPQQRLVRIEDLKNGDYVHISAKYTYTAADRSKRKGSCEGFGQIVKDGKIIYDDNKFLQWDIYIITSQETINNVEMRGENSEGARWLKPEDIISYEMFYASQEEINIINDIYSEVDQPAWNDEVGRYDVKTKTFTKK